jgi:hypothetical protein
MMEAARTSETSADNYFTRQYIPEDNSELHTRRCENLKSHGLHLSSLSKITIDSLEVAPSIIRSPVFGSCAMLCNLKP